MSKKNRRFSGNRRSNNHQNHTNADMNERTRTEAQNNSAQANQNAGPPNWVEKGMFFITVLVFLAACYAAYEAERLANLTNTSVTDSRMATIEANRAWIAVRSVRLQEPAIKIGDPLVAIVVYEVLGRQPALDVVKYQEAFWIDNPTSQRRDIPELKIPPNETCSKATVETGIAWPGAPPMSSGGSITDEQVVSGDLFSYAKIFAYHGCFQYTTFGQTHVTAFCWVLDPKMNAPVSQWIWILCPGSRQNFAD